MATKKLQVKPNGDAAKKGPATKPKPLFSAGDYMVTPPPEGGENALLGPAFQPGDDPRKIALSAAAASELSGPHHPWKLELVKDNADA